MTLGTILESTSALAETSRAPASLVLRPEYGIESADVLCPEWALGRWAARSTLRTVLAPAGDELFSPFVSPGWSGQAERNLRPAQWLGLLKVMVAWGAEWFYAGFFSLRAPFQPADNWCWQAMMPAYAQALVAGS